MEKEFKLMTTSTIIITSIAMLVLIAIAVISQYEYVLRVATNESTNGITVATNGSFTNFGTTRPFVSLVSGCVNASAAADVLATANYTIVEGTEAGGGFILADAAARFSGESINCSSVTYRAATTASANADTWTAGLTVFATFMAVIVIALMGKIIFGIFNRK